MSDIKLKNVSTPKELLETFKSMAIKNQDLGEQGFSAVSGTYYKHTGASATNYATGKIYYYDGTEYKAIDGSGINNKFVNGEVLEFTSGVTVNNEILEV